MVSHYQNGDILASEDGENDPCRELANGTAEECTYRLNLLMHNVHFMINQMSITKDFSTESNESLSDYIYDKLIVKVMNK